jgi:hypothetical protein
LPFFLQKNHHPLLLQEGRVHARYENINIKEHYTGSISEQHPEDEKMLKSLIKFEESHQAILKEEIRKLDETNHWKLAR